MQFIKPGSTINFIGNRRVALIISLILILITVISLIYKKGPNYGIDFAGGILVHARFKGDVSINKLRASFADLDLGDVLIQDFGENDNEYLIRVEAARGEGSEMSQKIRANLNDKFGQDKYEVRRVEMVGPQVGGDLKKKALLAVIYALIGILIYVSVRFELRYAVGAIVAIAHDVVITVGAFSITGYEVSLPVIAAILAVVGYSLNDTIIVFDRIRENLKTSKKGNDIDVINKSINETLSRTLLTSITTLIVVFVLFIFGGGVIHNFAFALMVGIIVGTYSSIFVASPVLIYYNSLFSKNKAA